MPLNKSKGDMYNFVTHTWNAIKGECSHDCVYCYMKRFKQNPVRLDEKELKTDLGSGNFIFVGSGTDMFADDVPIEWILKVLKYCKSFDNKYLFQTKNTYRLNCYDVIRNLPKNIVLGTTIETASSALLNDKTPHPWNRAHQLSLFKDIDKMVTIEPIMDFNLESLVAVIQEASPAWVNIGADSCGHKLPEPSWDKVQALIVELKKFTEVKCKSNLERLKP